MAAQGTRLAGAVRPLQPHTRLSTLYFYIERFLMKYPDCDYKKNTETIIKYRKSVLQETENLHEIECMINCGSFDQLIIQAERELNLMKMLLPYKPWEPLVNPPPERQWTWPIVRE